VNIRVKKYFYVTTVVNLCSRVWHNSNHSGPQENTSSVTLNISLILNRLFAIFVIISPNINTTRQSITQHFIYIKNSIFCQVDMFRPYKVILRPCKKTDPRVVYVTLHYGIPNAYKVLLEKCKTCKHLGSHKNSIFCQGDMFRPYKVILRPCKKTDPRVVYVTLHCGILKCKTCKHLGSHNAKKYKQLLDLSSWRVWRWPYKVETRRPDKIYYFCI